MPLPRFVPPMLARIGTPFDSPEHLFEVKWDGVRALAFVEGGALRLMSRREVDVTAKYPDLAGLAALPDGTVLDGELVALRDGRAELGAIMTRENASGPRRAAELARRVPASYVVFDLLYDAGADVMRRPLHERRARLTALTEARADLPMIVSEGVTEHGVAFFEQACARRLEGVVAKHLDSRYSPGARSDAWLKIKPVRRLHCAILGWDPDGPDDIKSLIVAAPDDDGRLRCVGKVGSGLTAAIKRRLLPQLAARRRETPLVECDLGGEWVEPGLYCTVSFVERTRNGMLRAPVFVDLVDDA